MAGKVQLLVEMDVDEHSFSGTPHQAKEILENMLKRDPRYALYHMQVTLQSAGFSNDDVSAWAATAEPTHRHRNVFDKGS